LSGFSLGQRRASARPWGEALGQGTDLKWLQDCDELPPVPTFPTLEMTTVQSCVGFEAIEGTAEVPSVAGPSDEEKVIKLEFGNGVGAGGAGLEADSERVETTAEVPTVLRTNMGQLAVGSASRDMLEFVSGVDIKDVEDLPRETIKLEDKLDRAAGEAHIPEETVKRRTTTCRGTSSRSVVVQEMTMHEALVGVAVQGEVPSAGVRRSWEATVEANQLAHARAAAAAPCRHAQWRLEHDELEGVAVPARSEEVQHFEELVVEGSFEVPHGVEEPAAEVQVDLAVGRFSVTLGQGRVVFAAARGLLWDEVFGEAVEKGPLQSCGSHQSFAALLEPWCEHIFEQVQSGERPRARGKVDEGRLRALAGQSDSQDRIHALSLVLQGRHQELFDEIGEAARRARAPSQARLGTQGFLG